MENNKGKLSYNARPGNQHTLKHGLERSIKQLQHGQPFTGPAAEAEAIVRAELETAGLGEIVKTGAIRLESLGRAFYYKACEALEQDDFEEADRFVKRAGWLMTSALRAWQQVEAMQKHADDGSIDAAITSIKGNNGNNSHTG